MNLQIKQARRKLIAVSLKFSSEDIRNGTVKSIYDKAQKAVGEYPKVNAVNKTLSYDFNAPKRLEKAKAFFEQMIEVYGEKKKPSQGGNPKKAKKNKTILSLAEK